LNFILYCTYSHLKKNKLKKKEKRKENFLVTYLSNFWKTTHILFIWINSSVTGTKGGFLESDQYSNSPNDLHLLASRKVNYHISYTAPSLYLHTLKIMKHFPTAFELTLISKFQFWCELFSCFITFSSVKNCNLFFTVKIAKFIVTSCFFYYDVFT
jgi:hypothetical protein